MCGAGLPLALWAVCVCVCVGRGGRTATGTVGSVCVCVGQDYYNLSSFFGFVYCGPLGELLVC